MPRLSIEHLSGPRAGQTDVVDALPATIGSDPGCTIVVPGTASCHARLTAEGLDIVLQDTGSGESISLAGEAVRQAQLRDGDIIEIGPETRLRFHHHGEHHPELHSRSRLLFPWSPFRVTLATVLILGTVVLGWSCRESRRLNREVDRLNTALRVAEEKRQALVNRIEEERDRNQTDRASLESKITESRQREEDLSKRLADARGNEVAALRDELQGARQRLAVLEEERAAGERIIRQFGAGVCLIHGSYSFFDSSGHPLRYRTDGEGQPLRALDGSVVLETEGTGPIHNVDYFGTGFLADRKGSVLTNRHVAEPWWKDEAAQAMVQQGFTPRFRVFRAFFPRVPDPLSLELLRISESVDLAVLRIDLKGRKVPVLPLDVGEQGAIAGQPVVLVGYPTGLEAILAKADAALVQEILSAQGTNAERVTEALSRRGLIRPSTTQGHIGDVTRTDIVFDAPTTQGGSGGPVFNKRGQVIAVEYAVLSRFGGNSFGLPVRHAVELLKEPRK